MKINEKRGVTLIALVVTISVMLIIAGVAISTISGSDNIITQSKKGIENIDLKEETDAIRSAIQETMLADSRGKVSKDIFEKYLKQHIDISDFNENTDGTFSFKVIKSENTYIVKSNGEFSQESED